MQYQNTTTPHIYINNENHKIYFADSTTKHHYFYELNGATQNIFTVKSRYQLIQIMEITDYGKTLAIDGTIQCAEKDEYLYHESLVHPALALHPGAKKNIFIAGGGDGAALREILKHDSVQKVTLVDIDETVMHATKTRMPFLWNNAFDDKRVRIITGNADRELKRCNAQNEKFDIIYLDVTDAAEGTSDRLFTEDFFKLVKNSLKKNGFAVGQSDEISEICREPSRLRLWNLMRATFGTPNVRPYKVYIPSFAGERSFVLAACRTCFKKRSFETALTPAQKKKIKQSGVLTSFYNPETHRALFTVPPTLKKIYYR